MPGADRFPVQPLRIAGGRLSMACPKVCPRFSSARSPVLALVAADDLRLDLARAADDVRQGGRVARQQRLEVRLEPRRRTPRSQMRPYLMTSASPARSSRSRQASRACSVSASTALRLVERADQVLAARVIDAGLAADGRIHLRQQRRRHLHERDAALVAGGAKPARSPTTPPPSASTAQSRAEAVGDQDIEHARSVGQRLVRLAVRQDDFDDAPRRRGQRAAAAGTAARRWYC